MHLRKHPSEQEGQSQEGATTETEYDLLRLWKSYSDTRQKVSVELGDTEHKGWTMKAENAGSWDWVCEGP